MTVKELKEILNTLPDDMEVWVNDYEQGEEEAMQAYEHEKPTWVYYKKEDTYVPGPPKKVLMIE